MSILFEVKLYMDIASVTTSKEFSSFLIIEGTNLFLKRLKLRKILLNLVLQILISAFDLSNQ